MPEVLNPAVVKLTIGMRYQGQEALNVLHAERLDQGPFDITNVQELANDVGDWWQSDFAAVASNQLVLEYVRVRQLAAVQPLEATYIPTVNVAGLLAGEPMPNNVTIAVTKNTAFAGRANTGRLYMAGIIRDYVTGNVLDEEPAENISAAFQALMTAVFASGWALGIYSTVFDKQPRDVGVLAQLLSMGITNRTLDSQRRRLPERGS